MKGPFDFFREDEEKTNSISPVPRVVATDVDEDDVNVEEKPTGERKKCEMTEVSASDKGRRRRGRFMAVSSFGYPTFCVVTDGGGSAACPEGYLPIALVSFALLP
ncbi:P-loop containing nucleoside triphosphatehydrolases superfamily protein [Striga asiatica]|uniref:P-loop containing nucleoside triphosphatehydrolases superfamily protein n=1 Tax=Striga asiatica TaxID=4170 RepID=A0A5A7Q0A7_STRAF|nr:P-loop containing nucleoside triphosphatehydrolases superfamily protein [Striga asiatica]